METLQQLRSAVEQGFLLHGSLRQLTSLVPKQARDSEKVSGNRSAVYATKNVLIAVLCGLRHPTGRNFIFGWTGVEEDLKVFGHDVKLEDGYVYLLSADKFQQTFNDDGSPSGEYASEKEVIPAGVVAITPEILSQFPDLVIEIEDKA